MSTTDIKSTCNDAEATAISTTWRERASRADWDKLLTDGMIYLLALGGFYVGYQTLYTQALRVGIPSDQAVVIAALADIAILAYSRKAVREVKAGRSARIIRAIVAVFSIATFGLQLRAAWGDPLAVAFHALPPAVWILGHEMMLRGRLRDAKAARRAEQIATGLRPAPLPAIRRTWWLLDPQNTFTVWRLTKLWELPQGDVIRKETADRQARGEKIPRAWQGYLLASQPPAAEPVAEEHDEDLDEEGTGLHRLSDPTAEVSDEDFDAFLMLLPVAPLKGRPMDKAIDYIRDVDELAAHNDIAVTDRFIAGMLDVDPSRVSKLRKVMTPTT
jgi:hypothetical protein